MSVINLPNPQEQAWIDQARRGDAAAFEELVHCYEKWVFALTTRLCRNPQDAQEAAQEAFISAWQGLPAFRGNASFSTWLYRLTRNACMDILRREQRHTAAAGPSLDDEDALPEMPSSAPTPAQALEQAELRRAIEAGLAALPESYREVLVLREIHQLSYDEIAAATASDLGTVKSRISRGRKLLRKFLVETGNFSLGNASNSAEKEGCE